MRFFGFGKKPTAHAEDPKVVPDKGETHLSNSPPDREIIVYGTSDGGRCRQLRALLENRGYAYQDVRVNHDLSMRSWVQRMTGNDALPKVFIGTKCYGGFEDMQILAFDGRLDRIVRGEADADDKNAEVAALKGEMSANAICTLLRQGEILTITEGGMATDTWTEPLANPPLVYYEGAPHSIDALESIVGQIITRLTAGEIEVRWKEDR